MTVTYRDAVPEDSDALAELGRATFVETFGHLYAPDDLAAFLETHRPEQWEADLRAGGLAVRLAEEQGQAVAYAKVGPRSLPVETERAAVELRQFYVLGPWQGRGISTDLMAWVLAEARSRGADELYLSVYIDNHRARRFYARYGFQQVGEYAFMVGNHADRDLIMRLDLETACVD